MHKIFKVYNIFKIYTPTKVSWQLDNKNGGN